MKRLALLFLALLLTSGGQTLQVRLEPAAATVRAGAQIRTVAQATGGTPPYRFEWFVGHERTGEVNQARVWVLRTPGSFPIRVVATDAEGRTGAAEGRLTVEAFGARLEGSGPVIATAWGLTPPYTFQVFAGDSPQGPPRTSSSPRESFPSGVVRVRITDANGVEAWAAAGGAAPPPPPSPSPSGDGFL